MSQASVALVLLARVFGPCQDPCVVEYSRGGHVAWFEQAAHAARAAQVQVVINGFCGSSCMTLASEARPYVCITPRAVFAFHRTNYGDPIPLGRDLDAWVRRRGGYPPFRGVPGRMSYESARSFWPACGPRAPEGLNEQ
jgi:hypothetical protein